MTSPTERVCTIKEIEMIPLLPTEQWDEFQKRCHVYGARQHMSPSCVQDLVEIFREYSEAHEKEMRELWAKKIQEIRSASRYDVENETTLCKSDVLALFNEDKNKS